jgi:hypothetical protein
MCSCACAGRRPMAKPLCPHCRCQICYDFRRSRGSAADPLRERVIVTHPGGFPQLIAERPSAFTLTKQALHSRGCWDRCPLAANLDRTAASRTRSHSLIRQVACATS